MKNIPTFKEFIGESKNLDEASNNDMIDRSLNLLDAAADMAIKNPKGNVTELANIIKKYVKDTRKYLK